MVTCRPDISYPLIKLSQYSNNSAHEHYHNIKQIFRYFKATKLDGIYFWQKLPCNDLPVISLPSVQPQTFSVDQTLQYISSTIIHIAVDSD